MFPDADLDVLSVRRFTRGKTFTTVCVNICGLGCVGVLFINWIASLLISTFRVAFLWIFKELLLSVSLCKCLKIVRRLPRPEQEHIYDIYIYIYVSIYTALGLFYTIVEKNSF